MKIVGFVGSPRKSGNTDALVAEVLCGAAEKGAETKSYNLNALNIRGCQGCWKCKAVDRCVVKDDMIALHDEILGSDGIVLGSPIYMFQITAQTKILVDRLFALLNPDYSPRFKKGLPIVLAYTQMESNAEAFRGYFDLNDKLFNDMGFRVVETMVAAGTSDPGDVAKQTELMAMARETGRKLVS